MMDDAQPKMGHTALYRLYDRAGGRVTLPEIPKYVPYGLFEPVQEYLDNAMVASEGETP